MWFTFKYLLFLTCYPIAIAAFIIYFKMHGVVVFGPISMMWLLGATALLGVMWVIYFFILILIILVRTTNDVENHFKNQKQTTRK